jgi:hypothetical protein
MTTVPSNLVPTRISQLTEYDGLSQDGYLPYVLNGVTYKVRFGNIASVGAVPSSRTITGGGGLTGGGDLSANRVISIADGGVGYTQLADSGVVAATYGSASEIPVLQIDAKGRVEVASTTPISLTGYVPTSRSILAGAGLTGGGTLAADRTIALSLSAALPQAGGVPSSGSSTTAARDDHVHPAVDLSDTAETTGVLPLARGGTGSSLSPVAGAILYSDGSNVDMSNPGTANQVLFSEGTSAPTWRNITAGSTGLSFGLSGSAWTLSGTLAVASGGTGATTAAAARVNLLPSYAGNGGRVLALNSTASDTEWLAISGLGTVTSVNVSGGSTGLTTSGGPITGAGTITLAGTLITPNGGTGLSTYTAGDMLYYAAGDALSKLALGASTYMLTSDGAAPQWTDPTTITVGNATNAVNATNATNAANATNATNATTATNIAGGAAGSIPYQTASNTTALLAAGTGVLIGGSTPSYTASPSLTQVTVAADPTLALQVATKQYVDTLVSSGITYHQAVKYEVPNSTGDLNATYNNGTAGVGATLTNAGTLAAFAPDGPTAQVGDRILIYNQTNAFENGVYEVTTVGSGSVAWVLTRTTDADSYGLKDTNALGEGDAFFITSGNTGAGETYVCTTQGTITFGTTAINFSQISSAQIYSAGTGLTLTGTQFSLTTPVATTLGGTGLTTFTANGAVYATSTSALATGTLPVNAGGTSFTSYTDGEILIGKTDGSLAKSTITAGTGVSVTNGNGSITIANTAPDQTVVLTGGTGISTSGTYPNFTITNTAPDQVVSITGGTNISVTGTYPNFTVSASGGGSVTSVSGTGTVNGITLTGTVTSSGSLTLGGTLSGVDLTTQVTGTLPVANGGTGATTLSANAVLLGNGTSALQTVAPGTAGNVLVSNGTTWTSTTPPPSGISQAKVTGINFIFGL